MPSINIQIFSFNAGEWSPRLEGRVDLQKYYSSCRICENFIPMTHGPVQRRPGTYYVADAKYFNRKARLVPFEFSTKQAYILEFGHNYIRVYKDRTQVQSGGVAYEVVTTYTEDEIFELSFAQSADILYIAHSAHPPAMLTRTSDTSWTLSDVAFVDGPYMEENSDASLQLTPSATTGNITLTSNYDVFTAENIGSFFNMKHASTYGHVMITAFTGERNVSATVISTLGGTGATTIWREGAFSLRRGYPSCVSFFEERLVWACTDYQPQTMFFSESANFYTHTPNGTDAGDAMVYTINSDQVNVIRWMVPQDYLIVGTTGGEWKVGGETKDDPITPTSVTVRRQSTYGSSIVSGLLLNDAVLFVQRQGKKVREISYDYKKDGYVSADLTILAEHIAGDGITSMDYQSEPDSILWATRDDGVLLGMTYERAQDVIGWFRCVTDGEFESVAIIPGDGEDEIWVTVKRVIAGETKRFVEYFSARDFGSLKEDGFFVDSGLTWDTGTAASSFSGLDHLAGATVDICADGAALEQQIVSPDGAITLDADYEVVHIGLPFSSTLKPMRIEGGGGLGTSQGQIKSIHHATVRVDKTLSCQVGPSFDKLHDISFGMDPELYTGDTYKVPLKGGLNTNGDVMIYVDKPLPCTILGIILEADVYDTRGNRGE